MTCGVYRIVNQHNNKFYIGSSTNIETRWKNHKSSLRHNHHPNLHLQSAWNKYGESMFVLEVLYIVSKNKLKSLEQSLLNEFITSKQCYNISKHADAPMRNRIHSGVTKQRMSVVRRGQKKSQDWKDRIRQSNIESWKEKMTSSVVRKRHQQTSKYWLGKQFTSSHLHNLRRAGISTWSSLTDAEKQLRREKIAGENSPCAKVTAEIVRQIRSEYSVGAVTQKSLATRYELRPDHIHDIVRFKTWKFV